MFINVTMVTDPSLFITATDPFSFIHLLLVTDPSVLIYFTRVADPLLFILL